MAFSARDDEVLLSGPAGTGKSRACLEKLHACALANPGMRGLIARKYAKNLAEAALVTWEKQVLPEALQAGLVSYFGGSGKEPAKYRYANGSEIVIGGLDKDSRIMSTEYDMVYVQEAIELDKQEWEALSTRLRHGTMAFQQIIADTNPDAPGHWLHQRCMAGGTRMIPSRHTDNPRYYADQPPADDPDRAPDAMANGEPYWLTEPGRAYMKRLDRLTGTRRQRLKDGLWVAAEGIVYEEWDPARHMAEPRQIPEHWRRVWAIDFGFRHAFVCQWWAVDDDGELWRYRELLGTGKTVEDWAQIILGQVRRPRERTAKDPDDWEPDWTDEDDWVWTEPEPEKIICDHDQEGQVVLQRKLGLPTRDAYKKVNEGIDAVKQRMKDGRIHLIRGALVEADQNLVELNKPTCTEDEIPRYKWDEKKERPVKVDDDGCDTMRYVVAYEDLSARSNVRF